MQINMQDYMDAALSSIGDLQWRQDILLNEEFLVHYFESRNQSIFRINETRQYFLEKKMTFIDKIRRNGCKLDEIYFINESQDKEDAFFKKIIDENINSTLRNLNVVKNIIGENILLKYDSIEPYVENLNESFLPIKKFKLKSKSKTTKCSLDGRKVCCEDTDVSLFKHLDERNNSKYNKIYYVDESNEESMAKASKDLIHFKYTELPFINVHENAVSKYKIRACANQFWKRDDGVLETIDAKPIIAINVMMGKKS